ncbi:MAG: hypothetical protein QMC90_04925, partial [Dehalococcoidales bacterium]|nr:hypothetical protein [Dehalococcoidales bacterium]
LSILAAEKAKKIYAVEVDPRVFEAGREFVEKLGYILRGAKKEIPLPLEELYLSWQAIGGKHDELDFFVLGVAAKSYRCRGSDTGRGRNKALHYGPKAAGIG